MRHTLTFIALLACSCEAPCEDQPCATTPLDVAAEDFHVRLDRQSALVSLVIDGRDADLTVEGDFVFSTDAPSCVASSDNPCSLVLKEVRLRPGAFDLPTSEGTFGVEDMLLSLTRPLELVDRGSGFVVPSGTPFRSCSTVDGRLDSAATELTEGASMNVDIPNQGFSIEGVFPLTVHVGQDSCTRIEASVTIVASGQKPWDATP